MTKVNGAWHTREYQESTLQLSLSKEKIKKTIEQDENIAQLSFP